MVGKLLSERRIAVLVTDGYEDVELTAPWRAIEQAGATPVLVAPAAGHVVGKRGHEQAVDETSDIAQASDYDGLMLPGGVVNADHLRMDPSSVQLVRAFFGQHKPVAVICHGAWILADADVLGGRTLTSYPSLRTDLVNAGATWVNQQVIVDEGLVSSRTPDDLPAFIDKMIEEFAEGKHQLQTV